MFQLRPLKKICEDFMVGHFNDVFLEETEDEHYQSAGLKYKLKKDLNVPPQLIKNILEKRNEINYPIPMMYLLPCMIESSKSNFQNIIFTECGGYKIDEFIDDIMTNKNPSIISVTFPYYSNSSAAITNNIISRLPNISATITKLELDILFDSSNHVYNGTCSFCNSTSESTWNCPNLRQLSLSYKPNLNSAEQNLCGENYCSSLFCNISFPPENLQELFLSSFLLDPSLLKNLRNFKNLEKLVLTKMVGGKFEEVIEAMCCLTKLKYLNFSDNECVKENQVGMNEQMKKLLNCLPHLDHIDVSLTALAEIDNKFHTWQRMRKFVYLGNSSGDEFMENVDEFIEILEHTEVNSILIPNYLFELSDFSRYDFDIRCDLVSANQIICTLINRRQIDFEEYTSYVAIFGHIVNYGLSDNMLQLFLDAFFCEDLSEKLLQIRSFIYLSSLQEYREEDSLDKDFIVYPLVVNLLKMDPRWAKLAFEVINLDDRLIPFVTWICRQYFYELKELPPFFDQFLEVVLPKRHQLRNSFAEKLNIFLKNICKKDKKYRKIIDMYKSDSNANLARCSNSMRQPAGIQNKRGAPKDDPSTQPPATKTQLVDEKTNLYISNLWIELLRNIPTWTS